MTDVGDTSHTHSALTTGSGTPAGVDSQTRPASWRRGLARAPPTDAGLGRVARLGQQAGSKPARGLFPGALTREAGDHAVGRRRRGEDARRREATLHPVPAEAPEGLRQPHSSSPAR